MTAVTAVLERLGRRAGVSVALVNIDAPGRASDRAAGLAAAAGALRAASCSPPSLRGHADDGRPLWPHGFTGSIAHAGSVAVAAASPAATFAAVGIDIERAAALPALDAIGVLSARENALVAVHEQPDAMATLMWSAKESAFKAWSTATDGGLGDVDPVDLRVEIDLDHGAFTVTACGALHEPTAGVGALRGVFETVDGYVLTLATAHHHATGGRARRPRK